MKVAAIYLSNLRTVQTREYEYKRVDARMLCLTLFIFTGKEEMLEVEGRIEKILGKLPSYEQARKKIEEIRKVDIRDPQEKRQYKFNIFFCYYI